MKPRYPQKIPKMLQSNGQYPAGHTKGKLRHLCQKVPKICSKIFHRKNYFYSTSLTCPQSLVQDCKLCPPLESLDHFSSRVSKSIQYKKCYLLFSCTFLPLFIVFIKKNCFLSFSFPFFFC